MRIFCGQDVYVNGQVSGFKFGPGLTDEAGFFCLVSVVRAAGIAGVVDPDCLAAQRKCPCICDPSPAAQQFVPECARLVVGVVVNQYQGERFLQPFEPGRR